MEIDIFMGNLAGLCKAEFEVSDKQTATDFVMPPFCLVDVTDTEWLAGGKLGGVSYVELSERLTELYYQPLYLP